MTPALAADLIDDINRSGKHHISMSDLEEIVRRDDKQRYAFNEDMTKIRANQGHSISVDVELEKRMPTGEHEQHNADNLFHNWSAGRYLQTTPRHLLLPL